MNKIIALFNQKGGVGKTTTTVNLSSCLGKLGKKILIVDLDPLCNTTTAFGIPKNNEKNMMNVLTRKDDNFNEIVVVTEFDNIHVIPASPRLSTLENVLPKIDDSQYILSSFLHNIINYYDYIFIDCPPSLGALSINGLVAARSVILPIQCEYYSEECIEQLKETIEFVRANYNYQLSIDGVVLSMFNGRANLSISVVENTKKLFKGVLFRTIIPRNIKLAEAPREGKPIVYYDSKCRGAEAFMELAEEFLELEEN